MTVVITLIWEELADLNDFIKKILMIIILFRSGLAS